MCEDSGRGTPLNAQRVQRLQQLVRDAQLDAVLLITGFDGCYNLESKGLVEWLCDLAAAPNADFRAAALEEGLFVAMPHELAWHVERDDQGEVDAGSMMTEQQQQQQQQPDAMAADDAAGGASAADCCQQQPASRGCCDSDTAAAAGEASTSAGGACGGHRGSACTPEPMDVEGAAAAAAAAAPAGGQQQLDGKLALLLQLHPRLRRVGIARGVEVQRGQQQQVSLGVLHRWPLLMAAAEQLRLPTEQLFEEVVDITPQLRGLLGGVDGAALSHILRQRRPLLTRAWLDSLGLCGRRTSTPKLDLTEALIAAPVIELVSGCGCRLKPGQYQPLALPPRVLLGQRTAQGEALSSASVSLRSQAAKQGSAVLHATLEAADACSPLRVARTLFFGQGAGALDTPLQLLLQARGCGGAAGGACGGGDGSTSSGSSSSSGMCQAAAAANGVAATAAAAAAGASSPAGCCQQQQQQQQLPLGAPLPGGDYEPDHVDLFDLMCWYWAAVDAAWQSMELYATQAGATWPAAHAHGTRVFWQAAAAAQLTPPQQQQQQQLPAICLQLFSWDGGPRPMPSTCHLEQHNMRFKTLRVTVSGIASRSPHHPGLPLGSVLYMDTFVDLPPIADMPAQLINATLTHCPTYSFNFWGSEAAANSQLVATFRRHLQLQLQLQQGLAAAAEQLRASAGGGGGGTSSSSGVSAGTALSPGGVTKAGSGQRRGSLGHQQQLLLLQQLSAAAASGAGDGKVSQQQLLLQLQQQYQQQLHQQQQQQAPSPASKAPSSSKQNKQKHASKASKAAGNAANSSSSSAQQQQQQPQQAPVAMESSCCGCSEEGTGASVQPSKPSCCGGGGQQPPALPLHAPDPSSDAPATPPGGASRANGAGSSGNAALDAGLALQLRALGRLLLPPGELPGEVALLFTGAMKLAVLDGPLYAHSGGFVFVSRPTKVHVVPLAQIEAVWLQDFASQLPGGYPDLGPCVVIRGRAPACGLLPAAHMTDNPHIAVSLRGMSTACSQHWVTAVLPAWSAAAPGISKPSKGASTPWPLPPAFQPFYGYWLQGARKRYMLPQPDAQLDRCIQLLDQRGPAREPVQQQQQPA